MQLRQYQETAIEVLWQALMSQKTVLLEAACSAGKTLIFSNIAKRLLNVKPDSRVLILTDREILVSQTQEKLIQQAPDLIADIGIVCAGVSKEKDLDKRITIASRQTLINRLERFPAVDLIIVDECHLLRIPKDSDDKLPPDQFGKIIKTLFDYNERCRLLGVTATPYRLVDGYIYGDHNSNGCLPYFENVTHKITVAELQAMGFLAPLIGKTIDIDMRKLKAELESISISGGEYNIGQLSDFMIQGRHVDSTVKAYKEHAKDRKKTIVFCASIEHCEAVQKVFLDAGIDAVCIHSKKDNTEDYSALQTQSGVYISVAMLTTGMDVPDIDCIIMARPTKSAALYKQILGRGQRIAEGKSNCLVLDLVGNNFVFGTDLDNLYILYKKRTDKKGNPIMKDCPECKTELYAAVRICPICGYRFPLSKEEKKAEEVKLKNIEYGGATISEYFVHRYRAHLHQSKQSGKLLLNLRWDVSYYEDELMPRSVNQYLCFPDFYEGFPVQRSKAIWYELTGTDMPENVNEAVERIENEIFVPDKMLIDFNKQFPEVKGYVYEKKETEDEIPF